MSKTEVKFKRQLIWFDEKTYKRAVKDSLMKISALEDCIAWAGYHITDINPEQFESDMLTYFYTKLGEQKKEFAQLKIRPEKIAELLDINTTELNRLKAVYDNAVGKIKFIKGEPAVDVDKEVYKKYTDSEEMNAELKVAKQLINAIKEVEKIRQVYPVQIVAGFNRFLNYNIGTQEWKLNTDKY
jgi:hypothetical protein